MGSKTLACWWHNDSRWSDEVIVPFQIKCRIMQTSPCNEYPLTPHFYIPVVKLGFTGVYIVFLFLL